MASAGSAGSWQRLVGQTALVLRRLVTACGPLGVLRCVRLGQSSTGAQRHDMRTCAHRAPAAEAARHPPQRRCRRRRRSATPAALRAAARPAPSLSGLRRRCRSLLAGRAAAAQRSSRLSCRRWRRRWRGRPARAPLLCRPHTRPSAARRRDPGPLLPCGARLPPVPRPAGPRPALHPDAWVLPPGRPRPPPAPRPAGPCPALRPGRQAPLLPLPPPPTPARQAASPRRALHVRSGLHHPREAPRRPPPAGPPGHDHSRCTSQPLRAHAWSVPPASTGAELACQPFPACSG